MSAQLMKKQLGNNLMKCDEILQKGAVLRRVDARSLPQQRNPTRSFPHATSVSLDLSLSTSLPPPGTTTRPGKVRFIFF